MKKIWFLSSSFFITFICYLEVLLHLLVKPKGSLKQSQAIHGVASKWAKRIVAVTPGWKVKVEGLENLPKPGTAVVFIANHASMSDIFVLYRLNTQFRWLAKESIFKTPMVGGAMRGAGYVPVKRGKRESHQEAMERSSYWLDQGIPMLFFPEGTRSKTAELREFKSGAFRLAKKHDVPVISICLSGTKELLEKGSLRPGNAVVRLKILSPEKVGDLEISAEAAKFREMIAKNR